MNDIEQRLCRLGMFLKAILEREIDQERVDGIKKHPCYILVKKNYTENKAVLDLCFEEAKKTLENFNGDIYEGLADYARAIMANFSKEEKQKNGKVYTGDKSIIKWIHDKLELYNPIDLKKTYWEPTCGTGSFVIDWYERLMIHWSNNKEKYLLKDEHEAHKWIIEKCLYFSDIDEFAIRLCVLRLYLKDPTVQCLWNKFVGDSLLDEPFKEKIEKFDYVAGNPPYISFQKGKLDKNYRGQLEKKYSVYHYRGDILNVFLQEGCNRGRISGFVTSRYWMQSESLTDLHKLLKPRIQAIWDHGSDDNDKFEDATVRTACFILTEVEKEEFFLEGFGDQTKEGLKDIRWNLGQEKVNFKDTVSLSSYCTVKDGIYTGANKVFVIPMNVAIEKEFIINPVITGDLVRKWHTLPATESLVSETSDASRVEYSYLEGNKEALEKRSTGKPFWQYMGGGFDKWIEEGIVARCYVERKYYGFAFRETGSYGLNSNVYLIIPKDSTKKKQIIAICNSKAMEYWFSTKVKRRTSTFMLTVGDYRNLPMPTTLDSRLDSLVDMMIANPNDKVTEAEINKIVYGLYDLTPEEIKTIEETVK